MVWVIGKIAVRSLDDGLVDCQGGNKKTPSLRECFMGLGDGLNGQSGHPAPQHPLDMVSEVFIDNFDTFFFMSNDI